MPQIITASLRRFRRPRIPRSSKCRTREIPRIRIGCRPRSRRCLRGSPRYANHSPVCCHQFTFLAAAEAVWSIVRNRLSIQKLRRKSKLLSGNAEFSRLLILAREYRLGEGITPERPCPKPGDGHVNAAVFVLLPEASGKRERFRDSMPNARGGGRVPRVRHSRTPGSARSCRQPSGENAVRTGDPVLVPAAERTFASGEALPLFLRTSIASSRTNFRLSSRFCKIPRTKQYQRNGTGTECGTATFRPAETT